MPTTKPLTNTLVSFALFLVLSYTIIGMSLIQVVGNENTAWYVYLVLIVLVPLSLFITFRTFINYKLIEFGNNQIAIKYRVRKKVKAYPLSEVQHWKESIVKTGKNSTFKEIEIQFTDRFKVALGLREYSNYPKVKAYLEKKLRTKKLEE